MRLFWVVLNILVPVINIIAGEPWIPTNKKMDSISLRFWEFRLESLWGSSWQTGLNPQKWVGGSARSSVLLNIVKDLGMLRPLAQAVLIALSVLLNMVKAVGLLILVERLKSNST